MVWCIASEKGIACLNYHARRQVEDEVIAGGGAIGERRPRPKPCHSTCLLLVGNAIAVKETLKRAMEVCSCITMSVSVIVAADLALR